MNNTLKKIIKAFGIAAAVITALIIGTIIIGFTFLCADDRMSKKEIIKYVIKNQEQLVTRICCNRAGKRTWQRKQ